jgi:hypothetical protein
VNNKIIRSKIDSRKQIVDSIATKCGVLIGADSSTFMNNKKKIDKA